MDWQNFAVFPHVINKKKNFTPDRQKLQSFRTWSTKYAIFFVFDWRNLRKFSAYNRRKLRFFSASDQRNLQFLTDSHKIKKKNYGKMKKFAILKIFKQPINKIFIFFAYDRQNFRFFGAVRQNLQFFRARLKKFTISQRLSKKN